MDIPSHSKFRMKGSLFTTGPKKERKRWKGKRWKRKDGKIAY